MARVSIPNPTGPCVENTCDHCRFPGQRLKKDGPGHESDDHRTLCRHRGITRTAIQKGKFPNRRRRLEDISEGVWKGGRRGGYPSVYP